MSVLLPVLGTMLVLGVARDAFHMLFHPSGQPGPTKLVFRAVWMLSGRCGALGRQLAGPISMVLLMTLWVGTTVVGWALIYLPSLPQDFVFASPLVREDQSGFVDALYYSWVTESTLGFGDITPTDGLLRLLAPAQATVGFGLFTMVVTWALSVYPALYRQRSAASFAHSMQRASERDGARPLRTSPATESQLQVLADKVNGVRADFVQYPTTFYFAAPAESLSLARALPFIISLTRAEGGSVEVQAARAQLSASLELLAHALAGSHLDMAGAAESDVFRAYLRHQKVEPFGALA